MIRTRLAGFLSGCILLTAMTACALSPQVIQVTPRIGVEAAPANGTRLLIEVRDSRPGQVIGYRGGVYDTASLTTAGDIRAPILQETTRAFREMGFEIVAAGSPFDASLVFNLEQLNYAARQNKLLWTIEVSAAIQAEAITGPRTTSNRIEDRLTKDFAKSPSSAQNEALINDVISRVLQRLAEDQNLITALRTRR